MQYPTGTWITKFNVFFKQHFKQQHPTCWHLTIPRTLFFWPMQCIWYQIMHKEVTTHCVFVSQLLMNSVSLTFVLKHMEPEVKTTLNILLIIRWIIFHSFCTYTSASTSIFFKLSVVFQEYIYHFQQCILTFCLPCRSDNSMCVHSRRY